MSKAPLRICLVEDHRDTRELLTMLLTYQGYAVEAASNCAEARALLARKRFDVLLSDIGLADGDGWTLLIELSVRDRPPYAIAMSGFGALGDSEKSRAAGFRHHLIKPQSLSRLVELMEEARAEADRAEA